jgi:hypothetical protein
MIVVRVSKVSRKATRFQSFVLTSYGKMDFREKVGEALKMGGGL